MIFTAMIRPILFNALQMDDPRSDGITISSVATTEKMYLSANWTPGFDIGGGNLIITLGTGVYAQYNESGGLILPGDGLPYTILRDTSNNPVLSGGNYTYAVPTFVGDTTVLSDYHEYTSFNSVITDRKYNLDGASGTDGTYVGIYDAGGNTAVSYVKGTLNSTSYFIHLAVPLIQVPGNLSEFIVILQSETTNSGISNEPIDLRQYIKNITWSTSIDKGFDTATIELNESASNLGKYYSYLLGQNVEIIDIYGNVCWQGIATSIYVDGAGGRIDAVGYRHTMDWFRFDKAYLAPEAGWSESVPGPTSSQVFHDTMLMNPYTRKLFTNSATPSQSTNWAINGFVYSYVAITDNFESTGNSWHSSQLIETSNIGLDELDFSDGSFKCIDAIETVESFGYAYTNESGINSKDTVYLQFWHSGFARVIRVRKDARFLKANYIITKKNLSTNNRGVELSGDINDAVTETYVIYNDSEGGRNISSSFYNSRLANRYGMRLRVESSDYGPSLAYLIADAARSDKSLTVGIGSVTITGNVKGGGGAMMNLPCYMMRAGRIVEFEDNIGHGSLYKNSDGTPGIFYVGSTSFSTSTGQLTLTAAETLSAVDLFIKRQSNLIN